MSIKLYVGNLSYQMSETQLKDLFMPFGEVGSVKIITDRATGKSKGFGFVEMTSRSQGEEAIKELNGKEINKRALTVNEARPLEARPPRSKESGGRSGGYRSNNNKTRS